MRPQFCATHAILISHNEKQTPCVRCPVVCPFAIHLQMNKPCRCKLQVAYCTNGWLTQRKWFITSHIRTCDRQHILSFCEMPNVTFSEFMRREKTKCNWCGNKNKSYSILWYIFFPIGIMACGCQFILISKNRSFDNETRKSLIAYVPSHRMQKNLLKYSFLNLFVQSIVDYLLPDGNGFVDHKWFGWWQRKKTKTGLEVIVFASTRVLNVLR